MPDASINILRERLAELRVEKRDYNDDTDVIALTTEISELAEYVLPSVLKNQATLSKDELREIIEDSDLNTLTDNNNNFSISVAEKILKARPLWISTVQSAPKRIPLLQGLFDLVVIDEATQCDIASTIPLMYRAKKVVILGDDKQLKPIPSIGKAQDLNFMRLHRLDLKKSARFSQSTLSFFDAALRVPNVEKTFLRSQYRSAPDIVEFINEQFYAGKLNVAVDFDALKCPPNQKPGITWTDVKPKLDLTNDHINRAEIVETVRHIKTLLVDRKYSGSIGFITPFRAQAFEFEKHVALEISPQLLAKARFKAATIDSFQGDERDLIFFSPVVSRSSTQGAINHVTRDFRRLNVAVSRAKAVLHVFGDLEYARSNNIQILARLAKFATRKKGRARGETTFDSEWERQVYYALIKRGLDPIPQYEIAGRRLDFALFGVGDIKIDVEVDGRRWHTDIDGGRKRQDIWRDQQLKSMGWKVERFWVDELDKNMERCIDRIEQELT